MTKKIDAPQELSDEDLDEAKGGVAQILPAIQKVRDPAARSTDPDGSSFTSGEGGGETEYELKNVIVTSYSTSGSAD